jgi:hypothetical protein
MKKKEYTSRPVVKVKFYPGRKAYLLAAGPEASVIVWADTGEERCYSSDQIEREEK